MDVQNTARLCTQKLKNIAHHNHNSNGLQANELDLGEQQLPGMNHHHGYGSN
jgi:hypothetical protein